MVTPCNQINGHVYSGSQKRPANQQDSSRLRAKEPPAGSSNAGWMELYGKCLKSFFLQVVSHVFPHTQCTIVEPNKPVNAVTQLALKQPCFLEPLTLKHFSCSLMLFFPQQITCTFQTIFSPSYCDCLFYPLPVSLFPFFCFPPQIMFKVELKKKNILTKKKYSKLNLCH